MTSPITIQSTVVCIATYRRNELLRELCRSIFEHSQPHPSVIVVDNDPAQGARMLVQSEFPEVRYIDEPTPGIAAARNAALDAVPADASAIVFVDDDERVHPGWLSSLIDHANTSGADVVTGPVISILPPRTPRWITAGGFIQREHFPTGPYQFLPATNNTLVRAEWLAGAGGFRFDEAFSLTGGSDTELFNRLRGKGASVHWCENAVVEETVPLERLTAKWIWKRGIRSGNVLARIQLQKRSGASVVASGIARFGYGVVRVTWNAVRLRPLQYADAIYIMRGIGFVNAVAGRLHVEYARPTSAGG